MTASAGSLVAAPAGSGPDRWAGFTLAEDVRAIDAAVRNGSWVDGALAGSGGALDGLAAVADPLGNLTQFGVAWLIEQVEPLAEALDWLAGDAAAISAHAQTWANVAGALTMEADGLGRAARSEVAGWSGAAAEAYRTWAGHRETELRALGTTAGTVSAMAEGAGGLVGSVRLMIRDAIAAVVARLVVYAVEVAATRGAALPLVMSQVTAVCAAWAARISRWLKGLIDSLRNLVTQSDKIQKLIRSLGGALGDARGAAGKAPDGVGRLGAGAGGTDGAGGTGDRGTGDLGSGDLGVGRLDAGKEHVPLGDGFRVGVDDPESLFVDKERAIADLLAAEGKMVHPRRRVEDVTGLTNPDAMVRSGPDDPGVVTEFKTPESASSSSMRSNILAAGKQLGQHGGGDVVIDGRPAGLTEEVARHGWARAAGQARAHGSALPDRARVILADGTMLELP
ncbi:WXG100 family type VII secretion target [Actinoplanes derwentensis]|uniref:tRNA nuclease CdiA C-terminal domain-containing protein n=1 Tax=Actinoplanes derwentensis TaxID=113562 RepID=A0A1H2CGG2_9ACTN|nr:hypothetical protein [Actinoplanes derwentensis]GID88758.1 hypothetical protein Ade03nite_76820 [Actinoplanes derwentensis]SDT69543.1 hypothetical protein SAMN04489716_5787 [Actinoplanes derwentensis]